MELVVSRSDFVRDLYLVQGIAERRNAIPILSNVLLEAKDGRIEFSATDLDISLRSSVDAQVSRPGSVTVNARKMYDIARSLPESDVHLQVTEGSWIHIRCAHSQFKIAGIPKDDFPILPDFSQSGEIQLGVELLRDLIERTSFAMTAEDHRYFLAGTLIVINKDDVALVTTDGHRLSYARRPNANHGGAAKRTLVPRKAVQELTRLLEGEGDISFSQTDQHLLFRIGRRVLASKVVEGQFPVFETVVSVQGDKVVLVDREKMLGALRRVSLLSSERTKAVKLSLETGKLTLAAFSPEQGEAQEDIAVEYDGESVIVGFNGQYLLDFLATAGTEQVRIELKNAESQGVFRPAGDIAADHKYVVMPMRL
jgi:DNA polymerase-3 subunit beta